MKIPRKQLKAIIKECLIEILSEGIGNGLGSSQQFSGYDEFEQSPQLETKIVREHVSNRRKFDPRLDTPVVRQLPKQQTVINEMVKNAAGNNPVMASIFADTARTTFVEQTQAPDSEMHVAGASRITQQEQFSGDPLDVFAESAGRWASLAFAEPAGIKKNV